MQILTFKSSIYVQDLSITQNNFMAKPKNSSYFHPVNESFIQYL